MKLAEALLERDALDARLELLQARLLRDVDAGRPTSHLQQDLRQTADQARNISIAIAWTEQVSSLLGLPLGAYRLRVKYLEELARVLEDVNQEKADEYWKSAQEDSRVIAAAVWLVDLQVPGGKDDAKEDK